MPDQEHSVKHERMDALVCGHCGGGKFVASKFTRPDGRICAVALICTG